MRTAVIASVALVVLGAGGFALSQRPELIGSVRQAVGLGGKGQPAVQAQTGAQAPAANGGQARPAQGGPRGGGPAQAVEVARSRAQPMTTDIQSVGSLQSDESVVVSSEVAGRVSALEFAEGTPVQAGTVLVKLDDSLTRAEITDVEARLALARANFERASTLSRSGNVTDRVRDEAQAALETSRAALELAKVRLGKLSIQAPFSGIVGLRRVSVGAFVSVGQPIVNLEKIDQLKLDFKVPEIHLANVRVGQEVDITVDALPSRTFRGTIYAINPMVDVNGRSLQVRARLANPDLVLRPGLFARVTVKGETERKAVFVPESAIMPRGGETYIFKVESGRAVEAKVTLGERKAGEVEIVNGIGADTTVIVAGQSRIRNGANVDVVSQMTNTRS